MTHRFGMQKRWFGRWGEIIIWSQAELLIRKRPKIQKINSNVNFNTFPLTNHKLAFPPTQNSKTHSNKFGRTLSRIELYDEFEVIVLDCFQLFLEYIRHCSQNVAELCFDLFFLFRPWTILISFLRQSTFLLHNSLPGYKFQQLQLRYSFYFLNRIDYYSRHVVNGYAWVEWLWWKRDLLSYSMHLLFSLTAQPLKWNATSEQLVFVITLLSSPFEKHLLFISSVRNSGDGIL